MISYVCNESDHLIVYVLTIMSTTSEGPISLLIIISMGSVLKKMAKLIAEGTSPNSRNSAFKRTPISRFMYFTRATVSRLQNHYGIILEIWRQTSLLKCFGCADGVSTQ